MINKLELDKYGIEERLNQLKFHKYQQERILQSIHDDFLNLQKTLPVLFPVRFRWISKLGHFDKNALIKIQFQLFDKFITLSFGDYVNNDYDIKITNKGSEDLKLLSLREGRIKSYQSFEEFSKLLVIFRENIPEYNKYLTRMEKFERILDDDDIS